MFSIVMPLWNKAATVERAVRSVLAQRFAGFELIVVDDGSTDGGAELLQPLADPRIRILRRENGGPGPARNSGIAAAVHDWIAFIDADDVWLPDHLAELDRIRGRHPEAGLIGCGYRTALAEDWEGPADQGRISLIPYLECVGRGEAPLWTSSAAIPARVFRSLGGFGPYPIGEDSEYWARIALAHPVAASSRRTAVYLRRPDGIMGRSRERWLGSDLRSVADIAPAAATVAAARAHGRSPAERRAIDLFLGRYIDWCLRQSVAIGDVATIRALRRLYLGPAPPEHRRLLAVARLPAPVAAAVYRCWPKLKSALTSRRIPRRP